MIPDQHVASPAADLFQALARHAREQPHAIACASRFRHASYRKLWSRVERATARLQGEWHVQPGDVVAYCGHGHPDALVLYAALARCAAVLLPLEHEAARAALPALSAGLKLVVFDDELSPPHVELAVHPLSGLIGERCPYQATAAPSDLAACSLLRMDADGSLRPFSLLQLAATPASGGHDVHGPLFDADVFGPVVLPTLLAGATLTWPA